MNNKHQSSFARIYDSSGKVVGSGFLISEMHLLTCDHVINDASGYSTEALTECHEIKFDFPLSNNPTHKVTGRPIKRLSANSLSTPARDIAVIEIDGLLPTGTSPGRLIQIDAPWGHAISTYGFPAGKDDGVWASGIMREKIGNGWVQVDDLTTTTHRIGPGFSGAAAQGNNLDGIVGMIVQSDRSDRVRSTLIIPTRALVEAWPQLKYEEICREPIYLTNHPRFAKSGCPPLLALASNTETYSSRHAALDTLVNAINDRDKNIIIVESPIGWGKDALIAKALHKYNGASFVVSLDSIWEGDKAIEAFLKGINLTDEEIFEIDQDQENALKKLRDILPEQTLIVILGASINQDYRLSPNVEKLIDRAIRAGFRCLVELWNRSEWIPKINSHCVAKINKRVFIGIDDDELKKWLSLHNINEPDIIDSFSLFDGNPLAIKNTIWRLRERLDADLPIKPEDILNEAIRWVEATEHYILRIEQILQRQIPEYIIGWYAMFWPEGLKRDLMDREQKELMDIGVELSLLKLREGKKYESSGWFHLFCLNKLREISPKISAESFFRQFELHYAEDQHVTIERIDSISRNLTEIAYATPTWKEPLDAILQTLRGSFRASIQNNNDVNQVCGEYIAATKPEALHQDRHNIDNPETIIWLIYESCRRGDACLIKQQWERLFNQYDVETLGHLLEQNWILVRAISRAYRISSVKKSIILEHSITLLQILGKVKGNGAGHYYHTANLLLSVIEDIADSASREKVDTAIELTAHHIDLLPPSTDYHRNEARLDLVYRFYRAKYLFGVGEAAKINFLKDILQTIKQSTQLSYKWRNRYLWVLTEALEYSTDKLEIDLAIFFDSESYEIIEEFLVNNLERFLDDRIAPGRAENILYKLAENEWAENGNGLQYPHNSRSFFTISCGLLTKKNKALDMGVKILNEIWVDTPSMKLEEGFLYLTCVCLKMAGEGNNFGSKKLKDALRKVSSERLLSLLLMTHSKAPKYLWREYLKYRVNRLRDLIAASTEPSEEERTFIERGSISALFDRVISQYPSAASVLLPVLYWFETSNFQFEKQKFNRELRPVKVYEVIRKFEEYCPNDVITWKYKAIYYRYIWSHEDAYNAAKMTCQLSRSSRRRRESLYSLCQLLVTYLYTPEILQSEYSYTLDTPEYREQLAEVVTQLIAFDDKNKVLELFVNGFDGDEQYWGQAVLAARDRIGKPEGFWSTLSDMPYTNISTNYFEEVLADLTDSRGIALMSKAFLWASQQDKFSDNFKMDLLEVSLQCTWAALSWERGERGRYDIAIDYNLAVIITLNLDKSTDGRIFGTEISPIQSKKSERKLLWKEAAQSRFHSVSQRATGSFKGHVDMLIDRFNHIWK